MCCGLTWISTGQLATARRVLQRTADTLAPYLQRGTRVIGLEPSCTAVFLSDARELMPGNRDVERLRTPWVLADGFSCRTQIEQGGTGRTPAHLAELLAAGLRRQPVQPARPVPPGAADYAGLAAGAGAAVGLSAGLAALARRRRGHG